MFKKSCNFEIKNDIIFTIMKYHTIYEIDSPCMISSNKKLGWYLHEKDN